MSACACGSERLATVSAKCSDMCRYRAGDRERSGYVPEGVGVEDGEGYGDYVTITYCLDCGRIRGSLPPCDHPRRKPLRSLA